MNLHHGRLAYLALPLSFVIASCHFHHGRSYSLANCERTFAEPARKAAVPPPDLEFAKLHENHSYFSIGNVGPFAAHFAVRFSCIEQSEDYYDVLADGTIEVVGRAWRGLAAPEGGKHPETPADQRSNAELVAARHANDYRGATTGDIDYLGSWRDVQLTERVPQSPPGDPFHRSLAHWTMSLHANADLTALVDKPRVADGGDTLMCWKDFDYVPCHDQHWLDFDAPPTTKVQLPALLQRDDALLNAALAAARDKSAGKPGADIETILAR